MPQGAQYELGDIVGMDAVIKGTRCLTLVRTAPQAACYSFAQFGTSYLWGLLSNRWGRKVGCCGSCCWQCLRRRCLLHASQAAGRPSSRPCPGRSP